MRKSKSTENLSTLATWNMENTYNLTRKSSSTQYVANGTCFICGCEIVQNVVNSLVATNSEARENLKTSCNFDICNPSMYQPRDFGILKTQRAVTYKNVTLTTYFSQPQVQQDIGENQPAWRLAVSKMESSHAMTQSHYLHNRICKRCISWNNVPETTLQMSSKTYKQSLDIVTQETDNTTYKQSKLTPKTNKSYSINLGSTKLIINKNTTNEQLKLTPKTNKAYSINLGLPNLINCNKYYTGLFKKPELFDCSVFCLMLILFLLPICLYAGLQFL